MNLLVLEPEEVGPNGEATIGGPRATHVREVLHLGVGDGLRVGVVDGPRGHGEIVALSHDKLTLQCRLDGAAPPRPRVDLLLAIPRPKVLKRLYAPLAALGIGQLLLTNATRVERFYFDSHAVREEVYRPLLLEGLAQAQDTRLPRVQVLRSLRRAVEDVVPETSGDARRLIADPAFRRSPYEVARGGEGERVLVALGPEGGWTSFERELFERQGFVGVGLGPRTQRSDVAAIALLALVHAGLDATDR